MLSKCAWRAKPLRRIQEKMKGWLRGHAPESRARTKADYFPDVPLQTQDGKTVRFYDDLLKGKIVVINFMYAGCGDICPAMMMNLLDVQKILGDRIGRDIFMYSITLQPELEISAILKAYSEGLGV